MVLEADKKPYLIRKSKSSHDADDRRNKENLLIRCGAAHFAALGDVDYRVATALTKLLVNCLGVEINNSLRKY
jgi:type III restriction enzyme